MRAAILFGHQVDAAAAEADPDDIIMKHLPDAARLAAWYAKGIRMLTLDDLQGAAMLGLLEAARDYKGDPATFHKYAAQAIISRMHQALKDEYGVNISFSKRRDAQALEENKGLTDEELCKKMGWKPERLRTARLALDAMELRASLDVKVTDEEDSATLGEFIVDPSPGPEEVLVGAMEAEEERKWWKQTINDLPPVLRNSVSLRAGIPVPKARTLALRDVTQACLSIQKSGGTRSIKRLREAWLSEKGEMVPGDGRATIGGNIVGANPAGAEGKSLAFDIWQRYTTGEDRPPNIPAGAVGN